MLKYLQLKEYKAGWECVIFFRNYFFSTFTCCEVSSFEQSNFQDYCMRRFLNIERRGVLRHPKKVQLLPRLLLHGCNVLCTGHWCIYFTIFSLCRFVVLLDRDFRYIVYCRSIY